MWSPPVTTAAPVVEPVTLEAAKEFLRIEADNGGFDVELGIVIAGVRGDAERISGTRFVTQSVRLSATRFADLARMPIGPVQQISAIAYTDTLGVAQTLEQGTYELFGEVLQQGIRPVWGTNWPSVADREGAVRVTLVVGYGASGAALPGDLYAALLRAIRGEFDDKPVPLEQLLINHRIWG